MMRLETKNGHDWQGFSRILEIISFVDDLDSIPPEEVREIGESFCDLPPDPGKSMTLEEVVFWAGFAAGMEFNRHAEDENVDPATAEKVLTFSSLFSHSVKNAIVDLALGQLEHPVEGTIRKVS
jgi:hypothetical protein